MKAQVFASASPGGQKTLVADVGLDVLTGSEWIGSIPFDGAQQYWEIRVDGVRQEVVLPPELSSIEAAGLAVTVLGARVLATFRPQAWIRAYAVDQDGREEFNALPVLIDMELSAVQELFGERSDFDCLADNLQARMSHPGPFEVDIEESDLVAMVCLLSSNHGALADDGRMRDVPMSWWDDACLAAHSIHKLRDSEIQSKKSPVSWEGFVDQFQPMPLPVARDPGNLLRSSSDSQLRQISDAEPARVWTVLDVGGAEKIINGFHDVQGAVYILCKVPYCGRDCEIASDSSPADVPRQRG